MMLHECVSRESQAFRIHLDDWGSWPSPGSTPGWMWLTLVGFFDLAKHWACSILHAKRTAAPVRHWTRRDWFAARPSSKLRSNVVGHSPFCQRLFFSETQACIQK